LNLVSVFFNKVFSFLIMVVVLGIILGLFVIYGRKFHFSNTPKIQRIKINQKYQNFSSFILHSSFVKPNTKLTA
ncbi:MAG: hypothetical protein LBQ05_00795, partial [Christensenellaceae bacterium]|nr:hypothetical protein [Christensenellaceae bacterium]